MIQFNNLKNKRIIKKTIISFISFVVILFLIALPYIITRDAGFFEAIAQFSALIFSGLSELFFGIVILILIIIVFGSLGNIMQGKELYKGEVLLLEVIITFICIVLGILFGILSAWII